MSGKIVMNLAMSLDGYIADEKGGFDWIAGQGDHTLDTAFKSDYDTFLEDVDIIVMGNNCYEQGFAKDYPGKTIYVATHHKRSAEDNIYFVGGDIVNIIDQEKGKDKNIFLFGGGVLINHFMKENAVDEFIIGIIPMILGGGRPLFLGNNPAIPLFLSAYSINDGIAVFHYKKR